MIHARKTYGAPSKPCDVSRAPSGILSGFQKRGMFTRFPIILFLLMSFEQASAFLPETVAPPLKGIPVPVTPGLLDGSAPIVVDQSAAIQLGKSLFWDMNVGSDGIACATCHFHAGSDRRTRNQLDPGSRHDAPSGKTFEPNASGKVTGPNYQLKAADFPFYRHEKLNDKNSRVIFSTDDVVSSSGVVHGEFQLATGQAKDGHDVCSPLSDDIFHLGEVSTRRVTTRNAPSVINAVFNYRNFWDGRANNRFNGETVYGSRSPGTGVWVMEDGKPVKIPVLLENASLASQAVGPPLDDKEMACTGRAFPNLARKLLSRRPLERQQVHAEDSVLAAVRNPSGWGLSLKYEDFVRKAFAPRYWQESGAFGASSFRDGKSYSQMEANFSFFFGLAIQLYEATLVSDETPFDSRRGADGFPSAFSDAQKRGLVSFQDLLCFKCHSGPAFTLAADAFTSGKAMSRTPRLVDRRVMNGDFDGVGVVLPLMDVGFANTSVTPTENDEGLGGRDPMGYPLSYSEQYQALLQDASKSLIDPIKIFPCFMTTPFTRDHRVDELEPVPFEEGGCAGVDRYNWVPKAGVVAEELKKSDQGRVLAAVKGAFKIPGLRNVELTGPYMHNGGMKDLREVIEFYDRAGNVTNRHHFASLVIPHALTESEKSDLMAFLVGLTDERVRWERAPFDHPEIRVPDGVLESSGISSVEDKVLFIPAVGRFGRARDGQPLSPFVDYLER